MAKHQILSRSSSEPGQPTFRSTHAPDHIRTADRCHTEENTLEQDQTNTDHLADHYTDTHANDDAQTQSAATAEVTRRHKQRPSGRDTVIKDSVQLTEGQVSVENETNDHRLEDEEGDKKKDTNMEPMEREETTDALRWVCCMCAVCKIRLVNNQITSASLKILHQYLFKVLSYFFILLYGRCLLIHISS